MTNHKRTPLGLRLYQHPSRHPAYSAGPESRHITTPLRLEPLFHLTCGDVPSEPCSSSGLIPEQRSAPMLFNSPHGLASGTSVAADVLMGITKPTNNRGITLAFSPWVWTGIRYDLCIFPCNPVMPVCLINDYASLFPMRTSFLLFYLINLSHDPLHFRGRITHYSHAR